MAAPQQQQYEYQTQYQIPPTTNSIIVANDPSSQYQSYDPSYYNAYYAQPQPQQQQPQQQPQPQQPPQQQDYTTAAASSYYYQDYSLVYPPGVDPNTQSSYLPSSQPAYYTPPVVPSHPPSGYFASGTSAPRGGSSVARGRGGGRGRGRGRGRGKPGPTSTSNAVTVAASQPMASSSTDAAPAPAPAPAPSKPREMQWCEICRVDCNTAEILEKHKNGKKHKKNLKVYEELQNLTKVSEAVQPTPEAENIGVTAPETDVANITEPSLVALPPPVVSTIDHFTPRGGFKRKGRGGGRGGKWMRTYDGLRGLFAPPPVPKQAVTLFCELCNVKCDSQVVFDTHIVGKKHLSNVKRFEGHKKVLGEGIKELYPTIPNLPSVPFVPQADPQQGAQDVQALAATMLSQQNLEDPQAAQAALVQLLHQHGIYDAQTLVTQLIPYLLAHFQAPGAVPVPFPQNAAPIQGTQFPTGPEIKTEQPDNVDNAESHQGGNEVNGKTDDGQSSDNAAVIKPTEDGDGGSVPVIAAPTEEGAVQDKN